MTKLEGITPGWSGLVFVFEGSFIDRGGKEISLALVGKAHLIRLISQSSVVMFETSRINAMLVQLVPHLRHLIREAYFRRLRNANAV